LLALRPPGRARDGHPGVVHGVPDRTVRFPDEVPSGPHRHVPDLRSMDRRGGRLRGGPRAPRDRPSDRPSGRLGPRTAGLRVDPRRGDLPRGYRVHRPLVPVRPRGAPPGGRLQRVARREGDRGPERVPVWIRLEPGPRTENPGRTDQASLRCKPSSPFGRQVHSPLRVSISSHDSLRAMMSRTTIPVSKELRDRLRRLASKGETYDDLLRRLIEDAENRLLYERERRILDAEEFVPLHET